MAETKNKDKKRKLKEEATTEEQSNEETTKDHKQKEDNKEDEDEELGESKSLDVAEDGKKSKKEDRKLDRDARKKEKELLMEKVPKVDADGISYTPFQIKRMVKRVKRGLAPVATENEENLRRRNENQLCREEEAELAGEMDGGEDDEEEEEEKEEADDDEEPESGDDSGAEEKDKEPEQKKQEAPKKKSRRSKPVPPNYVCSACKNKHQTPHWIYDCPDKITVRGTNKTAKKLRGLHDPDIRKVFVSGLPFDVKPGDVEKIFDGCGNIASCKLVKFGDTGRCNGQAYVSFGTDVGAKKALRLSGTMVENTKDETKKKGGKKPETPAKRVQLKLKVSKVLNRNYTKR